MLEQKNASLELQLRNLHAREKHLDEMEQQIKEARIVQRRIAADLVSIAERKIGFDTIQYQEFKKQMAADPTKKLRVATIFSYGANETEYEESTSGILEEENSEDTSALDQSSRDFLDSAIDDYNKMFHTSYSTDGDQFQNYYKKILFL